MPCVERISMMWRIVNKKQAKIVRRLFMEFLWGRLPIILSGFLRGKVLRVGTAAQNGSP